MQVVTALLCDYASVREGLLNILGGGVNRLWRAELPAPLDGVDNLRLTLHGGFRLGAFRFSSSRAGSE